MEPLGRIYSAGIADFANLRQMKCIYADKTDLVYRLANECRYAFLSRPRRFGKSLLCSTLKYYFQGRKDLFAGCAIESLEKEWAEYPVLHFDLSLCKNKETIEEIRGELHDQINRCERDCGLKAEGEAPGQRLKNLVETLYKTGKQVVVIFDEYDAPLLDYLHKDDELEHVRRIMQEFYQPVKACDQYLRFCFITGITKFSHLSIFSTLNNLRNISMKKEYSAICGITNHELDTTFAPDVELLAEYHKCSVAEMREKLKLKYDGYRFCVGGEDVYNPFSLTSALRDKDLENYWFSSGTPTFLFRQMQRFGTDILSLDRLEASAEDFDVPTESMQTILPLLYQSGYLTIKEAADGIYTLDYPNAEVRVGFMKNFLQQVMHITVGTGSTVIKVYHRLAAHDIDGAMGLLRSFFAGIPYLDRGEGALDADGRLYEQHFEQLMYVIFSLFNDRVRTQVKSACGRSDIVMRMPDATYVMEIKLDGSAAEALRQIGGKGYAVPYEADGRVVKIGVNFSSKTRTIENWQVEGGW